MRNPDEIDRNLEQPNLVDETGSTLLPSSSRRKFLGGVGGVTIALAAGSTALTPLLGSESSVAIAKEIGPEEPKRRINDARQLRFDAAREMALEGIPEHPSNGDEELFPNKIGNYSKGLRHNAIGEVDPGAYQALISAIDSGKFADFEALATNGHSRKFLPRVNTKLELESPRYRAPNVAGWGIDRSRKRCALGSINVFIG
jgi:hypothetical protein